MSTGKPSFFAELKRRNVYKVAIAYAVVGWLLIQVATQVFPFFEIPNWVVRLVVLVILIGFPIALVISWAFELTPEGLKRTETADAEPQLGRRRKGAWIYVVLIASAGAIGLFSIQHFTGWNNPSREKAIPESSQKSIAQPAAAAAKRPIDEKSIAVLPFDDLSPAHDQANFSDGMAEEILNALTRIKTLKVIARSSSFQFKGKDISPQQIGAELGRGARPARLGPQAGRAVADHGHPACKPPTACSSGRTSTMASSPMSLSCRNPARTILPTS